MVDSTNKLTNKRFFIYFTIFIFSLLSSCSKDDNKDEYIDYKRINGTWVNTIAKDSSVYIFSKGGTDVEFKFYTEKDGKQKLIETINYGKYKLTKDKILFLENGDIWKYEMLNNNDSINIIREKLILTYKKVS